MKEHISILMVVLIILLTNVSLITLGTELNLKDTIYVDDDGTADYTKIQDAIDNASDGDTIIVFSGTYNESIKIDKSINLKGIEKDNTDITKRITIKNTQWVNVSNFMISNNGWSGLSIENCQHVVIKNNIILNNEQIGIQITNSKNIFIENNEIFNCIMTGISVYLDCDSFFISNNIIDGRKNDESLCGLKINSNNNVIEYNIFKNCSRGIILNHYVNVGGPSNNQIRRNTFFNLPRGIMITNVESIVTENNFFGEFYREISPKQFRTLSCRIRNNYYDDWSGFGPKIIHGEFEYFFYPTWIEIPFLMFDWHPSKEPYDI